MPHLIFVMPHLIFVMPHLMSSLQSETLQLIQTNASRKQSYIKSRGWNPCRQKEGRREFEGLTLPFLKVNIL